MFNIILKIWFYSLKQSFVYLTGGENIGARRFFNLPSLFVLFLLTFLLFYLVLINVGTRLVPTRANFPSDQFQPKLISTISIPIQINFNHSIPTQISSNPYYFQSDQFPPIPIIFHPINYNQINFNLNIFQPDQFSFKLISTRSFTTQINSNSITSHLNQSPYV